MRRALMIVPLLFACAKTDVKVDAPPAPAMAAAPAPLTEADIAGTWTGDMMAAGSDSVMGTWTQICGGGTCKGIFSTAPKDTVTSTYMLMADSAMGSAPSHKDAMTKAMVTDQWIAHPKAGSVMGTGEIHLASKPDSVLMKYHFKGAKKM